jgi:hypothetical protein
MSSNRDGGVWWVMAQGRPWGPYRTTQMEGFFAEGRIGASSQVSADRTSGPWLPAANTRAFADRFETVSGTPVAE